MDVSFFYVFWIEFSIIISSSIRIYAYSCYIYIFIILSNWFIRNTYIITYLALMIFLSTKRYKLDIIRSCLLLISCCCAAMWLIVIGNDCQVSKQENKFCYKAILMIVRVNLIKFFNSIFFSGLITYSS